MFFRSWLSEPYYLRAAALPVIASALKISMLSWGYDNVAFTSSTSHFQPGGLVATVALETGDRRRVSNFKSILEAVSVLRSRAKRISAPV
jgi:hypothetical protein